jgi:RNA polymerase sigma factor (sigma-70 family)
MADLYRKNVICYESKDKSKFRWNGQLAFFYEHCRLVSLVCKKREFLERTGSPYSVIHFALPELVDIKNPDALNPLELQRNMSKWKKISVALKILGALDSIPGFLEARLQNDYVEMEKLFRDNVCFYKKETGAIKREIAFLYEIANVREEIEPILKEDKDINPLQFYKAALPEFFAHLIRKAFNQAEENKKLIGLVIKQLGAPEDPELFDKGFDALVRASLHFDEARGYKFSTLACTYIKKAINDHLARKRGEVSLDANISSPKGGGKEKSLGETISYDDDETPYEFCSGSESKIKLKSVIELALSELNPREQEIIKARFGFDGKEPKLLRELEKIFNVTKERIRQIEAVAIEKLRDYLESTGIKIDSFVLD